ncbi:ABC transporter substrate-binding protein [Streptomyces scopuliridis]|uniref:ABC transporter substrate-binding protein n=1 Tax=Streptomyces scopuliridis TaxID=452529 RepID=UPI00342D4FF2
MRKWTLGRSPAGGRRAGTLLALALLAGALGTGCGTESGRTAGTGLRVAVEAEPECLDPQVSPMDVTALVDRNIFDSLVDITPDGTVHPWLAERWTVSEDGLTYTFHLRAGVTFHDGTPVDAAAVKATLDHAVDPETKSNYAAGLIKGYTGARAVDEHTVRITLSRPNAAFLQALSTAYLGIQSPRSIRENKGRLCTNPVGSGPFRFTGWTKGREITLRKFPEYQWGPASARHTGPARIDGITVAFVAENSVRYGALASGQADVIDAVPPERVKSLKSDEDLRYQRFEAPGGVYALFLNTEGGPLADERVRQALRSSVDAGALVRAVYFNQYRRAWSPLSPSTPGYEPKTRDSWAYDPGRAGRLLDEAGWTGRDDDGYRTKDGRTLTLRWPATASLQAAQRNSLAQGIQAQAKEAGIKIDYATKDVGTYTTEVLERRLDIYASSNIRADADILRTNFASDQKPLQGGGNIFHAADRQLDGWLNGGLTALDTESRAAEYRAAQRYLVDRAFVIPMYVPAHLVGSSGRVRGITADGQAYPRFYDVTLEER